MIEFVFLDLDDTILDFRWAIKRSLIETMTAFGIDPSDENRELYRQISWEYWKRMDQGELTRDRMKVERFEAFLEQLGHEADAKAMAEVYDRWLGTGHLFLSGGEEAIRALAKKYRLFLATNGEPLIQYPRLDSADLTKYFEKIFISHEIGFFKPQVEFFEHCFSNIPGFDKAKAIMVGDSLASDVQGGINAGIRTCWINPEHREPHLDIKADYEIETLPQLLPILEELV